jgi:hypothetical protein
MRTAAEKTTATHREMRATLTKFRAYEPTRRQLRLALAKLDRDEIARRQSLIRRRRIEREQRAEAAMYAAQRLQLTPFVREKLV